MAGSSIYMNKAEVEATRGQYESQKAEFLSIVNTIKSTLWDLEGTWTGKAEQTYEAQARELLNNLQTIEQSLDGAMEKLNLAIQTYETVEQAQQAAINAVDAGASDYV